MWKYGLEILERDDSGQLHYLMRGYLDDEDLKELKSELKKKSFKRALLDAIQNGELELEPGRYLVYFFKEKRKKGRIRKKKVLASAEVEI